MTAAACSTDQVTAPDVGATEQVVIGGGLIDVQIANVANNIDVNVDVRDINVAVQVCAAVELLDADFGDDDVVCTITQN